MSSKRKASRILLVLVLIGVLVLNMEMATLPTANAVITVPIVTAITRDGFDTWPDTVRLTDPNQNSPPLYDASTGILGPQVIDIPGGGYSSQTSQHDYVIVIQWTSNYDPEVVAGFADIISWSVSGTQLTINAKSVARVSGDQTFYVLGFIVFFSSYTVTSMLSEIDGTMACFQAESFDVSEGELPGVLVITVTGYTGQTSGFFKLFMPASVPAQFGKTLNDVVITVDGAAISITSADTSSIVTKYGVLISGRLWTMTLSFSERTVTANPHGFPVGGYLAPVNKPSILTPYLVLVGLIGVASTVFVIRRRRKA